jgi:hypothetical protein
MAGSNHLLPVFEFVDNLWALLQGIKRLSLPSAVFFITVKIRKTLDSLVHNDKRFIMVSDYCYQFLGGDLCSYSILLGFTCPQ